MRSVAAQLVGDQASRHVSLVLQERAKEAHRGVASSTRSGRSAGTSVDSGTLLLVQRLRRVCRCLKATSCGSAASKAPKLARPDAKLATDRREVERRARDAALPVLHVRQQ